MKKIKVRQKLKLNKNTVAKLNAVEMNQVNGGGFLSIGRICSLENTCKRICGEDIANK